MKQSTLGKGTFSIANTLLHKAFIQDHTVKSDIPGKNRTNLLELHINTLLKQRLTTIKSVFKFIWNFRL